MNRAELERLGRDELLARADAAGIARARILTRPELVDELLLRTSPDPVTRQSRGWFGVARDLLARAIERGLHLPDAAGRIRSIGSQPTPSRPSAPAALPTVTLAEIYAAQGHRQRALETLEGVLLREPDHAAARSLLGQLKDSQYPVPPPKLPPEEAEPAPAASRYDVDECVAIPIEPRTVFVSWEVREATLEFLRAGHPEGCLSLRVVVIEPTWQGPRSHTRDQNVESMVGDEFVRDLPVASVVRTAIGWRVGDFFAPIAHSPALETPPGVGCPATADRLVRWTPQGTLPIAAADGDVGSIERAFERARRGVSSLPA